MTKKILLGLGATTALVGTSFAIVSCADDSTPEKTEATITYNKDAFNNSKDPENTGSDKSIDDYILYYNSDDNKGKLDAIFTSNPEGAIDSITVAKVDADNVKFTLTAAEGFILDKDTFDMFYDDGTTPHEPQEAKITFNKRAFKESRKFLRVGNPAEYAEAMAKPLNERLLDAIFTSSEEGAIESISVISASYQNDVIFTLFAKDEFTLSQTRFIIDYDDDSTPIKPEKTKASIKYNQDKFIDSKKESDGTDMSILDYTAAIVKPWNKDLLDTIFTSSEEGAIESISATPMKSNQKEVILFTLFAKDGFTLDKMRFFIDYDNGIQEAKITFNQKAFLESKNSITDPTEYANYMMTNPDNKKTLNKIITSNIEGAIDEIWVQPMGSDGKNVMFIVSSKGFTLDKNWIYASHVEFYIDYATGDEVNNE